MIDEDTITRGLHDLAERQDTTDAAAPPVAALLRRGRRTRLTRATGVFAAAAVLATGGVFALTGPPQSGTQPVPLALAAQTTETTTFRFRQVLGSKMLGMERDFEGAYDPMRERGYRRAPEPERQWEERQIGPDCYVRFLSATWSTAPRCWILEDDPENAALGVSGDPGELLRQLKGVGDVTYEGRSGEGTKALDTYRFSYPTSVRRGDGTLAGTVSGTVRIDVSTRRIVTVSSHAEFESIDGWGPIPRDVELTLFDFGTPVVVEVPPLN